MSTALPAELPRETFVNPIYEGADPFVVEQDGFYYLCASERGRGVAIYKSDRITHPGDKRVVWRTPETGWNRSGLWAPELHWVRGKWYVYYAADEGNNPTHRSGVLESVTDDAQGEYIDKGMLYTGDDIEGRTDNRWAIDLTVFELRDQLYAVWSGWEDERDIQWLYIAPMSNPWTISGNRVRLANNDDYAWERVDNNPEERGLHEGPQILHRDGKLMIVYSASSSWTRTYKLGLLWMDENDDPLDPASWRKLPEPIFAGTETIHGVGHNSFTKSPDGREDWIIYHSKLFTRPGWERAVWAQPFTWSEQGFPVIGKPVEAGEPLPVPSGEPTSLPIGGAFRDDFTSGHHDAWDFYGEGSLVAVAEGELHLGGRPDLLGRALHLGEKALVQGRAWADGVFETRFRMLEGDMTKDSGILLRVTQPAVGHDAFKGYYAGISPEGDAVIFGKCDGKTWTERSRAVLKFNPDEWYTLRVTARGGEFQVGLEDFVVFTVSDTDYPTGMAGVRAVNMHSVFDHFSVTPLE